MTDDPTPRAPRPSADRPRGWLGRLRARAARTGDSTAPGGAGTARDLYTDTRPAIVLGALVLAITFGGFGTWAAVSRIEGAVIAPGMVKVLSNRKQVQHLEGGIIDRIYVNNGDRVAQGDILVRLDETRARAQLDIYAKRLFTNRAAAARLAAELAGAEAVRFADALQAKAAATPAFAEILDAQRQLFKARRATLAGQIRVTRERIGQLEEQIEGRRAQARSNARQIALIEDELAGLEDLLEKGLTRKDRVSALRREAARLEGERGEHIAAIASSRRAISEAELEIVQYRQSFAERASEEMRERQAEISELTERVGAARFTLDHIDIRAPVSGTVVNMTAFTEGGVIQPGTRPDSTIMEIVPEDDVLVVEARVEPTDIDEVSPGQTAWVQFTAFASRNVPRLEGRVSYVSADILTDERQQVSYFTVRIEVGDAEVDRLGQGNRLQPGMPADVMIRTGSRTPLAYLLKPIKDSMDMAWRES
ncbi:hypothetical protein CCR85_01440 [Rhodothalassium salexigens]|uniref:HlyD family type I secretion periplasmic adaptor subunit n=1 Tax=Rhodothalassium salexigens TaxID=1086 RepID=UPI00191288B9|nr:HlyD family type I secretion periplasmic adaptor subunit [Rhodothalassium salexigens]MBK5910156.1 hypothetical protein [Rhodothalassium salexigens]MBK5920778.1 hypothetical protein [Rhodothalassium salexigens]